MFSAIPSPASSVPLGDTMSEWIGEITGHVAVRSVEVFARDAASERERDLRIVPGIPSGLQYYVIGAVVAGLLAWSVSAAWWARVWPREQQSEYAGRLGYYAARSVRLLIFLLVFLPVAGIPALLWAGALSFWSTMTAPFRAFARLRDRYRARA